METKPDGQLDFFEDLGGNRGTASGGNRSIDYIAARLEGCRRNRMRMGMRGCLVTSDNGSPAPADRTRDKTVRDG